jgi:hypothetical protein
MEDAKRVKSVGVKKKTRTSRNDMKQHRAAYSAKQRLDNFINNQRNIMRNNINNLIKAVNDAIIELNHFVFEHIIYNNGDYKPFKDYLYKEFNYHMNDHNDGLLHLFFNLQRTFEIYVGGILNPTQEQNREEKTIVAIINNFENHVNNLNVVLTQYNANHGNNNFGKRKLKKFTKVKKTLKIKH